MKFTYHPLVISESFHLSFLSLSHHPGEWERITHSTCLAVITITTLTFQMIIVWSAPHVTIPCSPRFFITWNVQQPWSVCQRMQYIAFTITLTWLECSNISPSSEGVIGPRPPLLRFKRDGFNLMTCIHTCWRVNIINDNNMKQHRCHSYSM